MRRMLSPNVSAYKLRGCSIVDATYYQKALKSKLLVLAGAATIALGLCLPLALRWRASGWLGPKLLRPRHWVCELQLTTSF